MAIDPAPRASDATRSTMATPAVTVAAPVVGEPDTAPPPPPAAPPPPSSGKTAKRIKARQVQRVVTRVDPWSMLKVSLLFAFSAWLIVVVAGVLLWRVAVSTGTIGNFEDFLAEALAEDTFTIDGGGVFRGSLIVGLVLFVTGAAFAVVSSVLFNLIAGLVGGVRFTVVELETARPVDDEPASGS
ncbi:MAG TPA: DUF3566 domain-containing protein [Acidimicrobiales bacterium]